MKEFVRSFALVVFVFIGSAAAGQGFLEQIDFGEASDYQSLQKMDLMQSQGRVNKDTPAIREVVSAGELLDINEPVLQQILLSSNDKKVISIQHDNESFELWLTESPVTAEGFQVFSASERDLPFTDYEGKFYWGVVKDFPGSFVSMAVYEDEVMGFFNVNGVDYTLGKVGDSEQHILYQNNDLLVTSDAHCALDEQLHDRRGHRSESQGARDANNCVNMYVEANYNVFQDKGSVANVTNYVLGLFNQVSIMYANESINFSVTELLVWDVPSPYSGPGSGDYLTQFRDELGGVYNGDLAHLVGYGGGGGVAYLDVLCSSYYGVGYSGINSGYNNVPTYSWSVMVVTHEIGHNLGSPHTHNCSWNGNGNPAIDGCGPEAGYSEGCEGPLPSAGTVMSYCHLVGGVGIDLSLGFGTQPGDLIRDNVYNAPCLGGCVGVDDCQDPYSITASNITDTQLELGWTQGGAAQNWDIEYGIDGFTPTGTPTIAATTNNPETIAGLSSSTTYDFYVQANCDGGEESNWVGPYTATTLASCPTPELITADNITSSSIELSWDQPLSANSWDIEYGISGFVPTGTPTETGVTNPYTVTGLTSGASYTFYVRANCNGGEQSSWSDPVTFTVLCDGTFGIPFTETFESSSVSRSCWTQFIELWGEQGGTGGEGELWTYQQGSSGGLIDAAYEGALNARYVSYSPSGAGSPVAKLISPELDLSGYDMLELSFFYGQEVWFGDQNELKVYYKSSPQDDWIELAHFTDNVDTWTQFVIPLENFSSTYRIAFEGINNWGRANVVDQVEVRPIPFSNLTETACDSYTLNDSTYTESGFYTQTVTSSAGGDSLIFLNLTINESTFSNLTESTCDEYDLNGTIYNSSGVYQQVITNAAGCDSTITLDLTIEGETDDCGECIVGGSTDPDWNQSCADCNGDPNGTAFLDNCGDCVGGNTGETACVQDCNGDFGGTAFLDNCGDCVGGNTGETACVQDCNGDFGGTAFLDNCGDCVGGNTGETACVQDCNGDFGGTAFLDNCGDCVGGNTGETACVQDCNGDFGGTAFLDNCGDCVGGNTGETACVQDCNGDFGGTAFLDNCGNCVGGNTGETACVQDCNGDFGGTAFLDNCGDCVGGNTGETACVQDCNGDFGGTAFLDNCGDCVGGNTGETACVQDCNGDFGGTAFLDNCGNCVGGNTGETACVQDCNGDFGGTAFLDNCGDCVEGNTGQLPCEQDCNGEYGGTAFLDNCDQCVGGSTGLEPCCGLDVSSSAVSADVGFANGSATVSVSGGTPPYSYVWNDPFLQTTSTAIGLFPGTYTCVITDSESCSTEVEVDVPLFTGVSETQLHPSYCNSGGHELNDFIACTPVQGADAYRWLFVEQGGEALSEYTRLGSNQWVRLQWIDGVQQGMSYDVQAKARVDGEWGEYGTPCTISTGSEIPLTEVRPQYHPTNSSGENYNLCDFAIAYNVSGATNYRWRFDPDTDPDNGNEIIYTRGAGNSATRLSWVGGLDPASIYHVAVKAAIGSTWGEYGTVHSIELAQPPAPVVRSSFCGQTYAPNAYVLSTSVCEADAYYFEFEPVGGGTVSTISSGNYVAFFNNASPSLSPGDYNVRVRVNQNGVLGNYGASCVITISGAGIQEEPIPALRVDQSDKVYDAVLFPNPSDGREVRVQLDNLGDGHHNIQIEVFDIFGKLVANENFGHQGDNLSQLIRFDRPVAAGMYTVRVIADQKPVAIERLVVN